MISQIYVYNRDYMDRFLREAMNRVIAKVQPTTWHLISIYTGESEHSSPEYLTEGAIKTLNMIGMKKSLSLRFGDITDKMTDVIKMYPNIPLFTKQQADAVVKFCNDRKAETTDDVLLLHCDAGISRSGAVAEFAAEVFGIPFDVFFRQNPQIMPNPFVRRLLRESAGLTGESAFQIRRWSDE
jgi:predicted protein tyrosine phosphatase